LNVTGATATFIPDSVLSNETTYDVTVTTAITDLADNALSLQRVTDFTTEPAPRLPPLTR